MLPGRGSRRLAILVAVLCAILVLGWRTVPAAAWVEHFARFIDGWGPWATVIYGAVYAIALVFCVPGAPFSVGAGLVWGMAALPLTWAAALLGACGCFLVSRYGLAGRVRPLVAGRPMLRALDQAVTEEGWRIVLLLRLNPLLPFNVQNYTFGVTRIGLWPYAAATAAGIVPGTALHVYFGVLAREAANESGAGLWRWVVLATGLAMTIMASAVMGRKVRAVLARQSTTVPDGSKP